MGIASNRRRYGVELGPRGNVVRVHARGIGPYCRPSASDPGWQQLLKPLEPFDQSIGHTGSERGISLLRGRKERNAGQAGRSGPLEEMDRVDSVLSGRHVGLERGGDELRRNEQEILTMEPKRPALRSLLEETPLAEVTNVHRLDRRRLVRSPQMRNRRGIGQGLENRLSRTAEGPGQHDLAVRRRRHARSARSAW